MSHLSLGNWDHLAVVGTADPVVDKLLSTRWDRGNGEGVIEAPRRNQAARACWRRQLSRCCVARSEGFHIQFVELLLQVVVVDHELRCVIIEDRDQPKLIRLL